MLNVNALQKTLSAMPLDRLQQYAQMHKNDPYVVAMALSVANTKKEALQAQQGMAGQQQMPKVVDQDIAQIAPHPQQQPAPAMGAAQQLPENQGIGQLPAPNMQRMAEGGIVAFGDGGEVPHYDGSAGSTVRGWNQYAPSGYGNSLAAAPTEAEIAEYNRLSSMGLRESFGEFLSKARNAVSDFLPETKPTVYNQQTSTRTAIPKEALGAAQDAQDAAIGPVGGLDTLIQNNGAAGKGQPTGNIDTRTKPPVADNKAGTSGLGALAGADVPSTKGFMQQLEGYLGKRAEVPEQADIEKSLEERQKPYLEAITKSVDEQRDKLKSGREEAIYMSMIKGGFAAAAGTSPNALTNIAKGGEAGLADLSESMKDLRKAAQEQHKMEIELSKAKMDASTGNLKTAWDRQDKAKQANAERDKLMATAYANITDTTVKANATVKAAGISATADQRTLEALGGAAPDSALRKGFDLKQEMTKRASLTELWAKQAYPSGNMGQPNEAFLARFPSPEVFIKEAMTSDQQSMGGGGGPNAGMQRAR